MRKVALLFVLALTFAACSTHDDADVPEGMLKRVKHTGFVPADSFDMRYYYNGKRLDRTESNNGEREIYFYDGDLIVNVKLYDETNLERETLYQYDDSGQIIQKHVIRYDIDWNTKHYYTYNGDSSVTEELYTFHDGNPEALYHTRQYFFADGEVSQHVTTFAESGLVQTATYTYDDKLVPEHGITGFDKIRMLEPETYKGVYHNIVGVTQTYSNTPEVDTYFHLWTYNEHGAPTGFMFDDAGTIIIDGGSNQYFYK